MSNIVVENLNIEDLIYVIRGRQVMLDNDVSVTNVMTI